MRLARSLTLPGLALLLAMPAGCGSGSDDDKAGDRRLPGLPAALYTLGKADGAEWESFGHLAHVAFDVDDNLYVLDAAVPVVYVYGPDGRLRQRIGRGGHGPGEFVMPLQLAVTDAGEVVVSDPGKRVFSIFDRAGRHLRDLPFAYPHLLAGVEIRPYSGGFATVYQPRAAPGSDTALIRIVRHSLDPAEPPRTLFEMADHDGVSAAVADVNEPAFLPRIQWGVLPDGGLAVARSADYRIEIVGPDGRVVRGVGRSIPPRRVNADDRAAERERRMQGLNDHDAAQLSPAARQVLLTQVRELRFAPVMPVIREFAVDRAGRIWVRREEGDRSAVDLVTDRGRYLGTVPGERLPVAFSGSGRVVYAELDEMDVQRLRLERIPSTWR